MAADPDRKLSNGKRRIDFQTEPASYRHWKLEVNGETATLLLDVDEKAGMFEGYELKLNSYDLRCDRAAALRASGGQGHSFALRQAARVLRRGQYPHAGGRHPRAQGEFLQVHQ